MRRLCWWLIRGYQLSLAPLFGNCCRFTPSCSRYAQEAILIHGVPKGVWLATRRICRCHPWHPGGEDPVPAAPPSRFRHPPTCSP